MASILVIDDEPTIRDLVRSMLLKAGHEVRLAAGGNEGLQRFEEQRPDLVITDIMLPDRDGVELLGLIQASAPTVPVIAISGGDHAALIDFLAIAERFGAVTSLSKPFRVAELIAAVDAALAGSADDQGRSTSP